MKKLFLSLLTLLIYVSAQAQLDSVFWFVAPEISEDGPSPNDRPIKLNISSFSNNPINVKISQPANPLFSPIVNVSSVSTFYCLKQNSLKLNYLRLKAEGFIIG